MLRYVATMVLVLATPAAFADCAFNFEPGTPPAVVYNMARRAIDPLISQPERAAIESFYFSKSFQAYQRHMTDQQSRDFDADTITGVQDYSDFTIVSVNQTMYGHDIEVVVSYGMTSKDEHGKSYPLIKSATS